MRKTKTALTAPKPLDTTKPVAKEFVDLNKALKRFIEISLNHVPYATINIKKVYQSPDEKTSRFRINFVKEGLTIVSKYIEVKTDENSKFTLVDLSGRIKIWYSNAHIAIMIF